MSATFVLTALWIISCSTVFTYLYFAYYIKHFHVAMVKHCLGTPLHIQWPVTAEQSYGFQAYPCSLVTDMHIYKFQWPCWVQKRPPQSPSSQWLHLMTFVIFILIFFPVLAGDMPGIGLTCPGRRWIMLRVLGVLDIESSMIIPFTQAGCRLSWLD